MAHLHAWSRDEDVEQEIEPSRLGDVRHVVRSDLTTTTKLRCYFGTVHYMHIHILYLHTYGSGKQFKKDYLFKFHIALFDFESTHLNNYL